MREKYKDFLCDLRDLGGPTALHLSKNDFIEEVASFPASNYGMRIFTSRIFGFKISVFRVFGLKVFRLVPNHIILLRRSLCADNA